MKWRELQESILEAAVLRELKRQMRAVLAELKKENLQIDDFFWDEHERRMRNAIVPVLEEIYRTGAARPTDVILGKKGVLDFLGELTSSSLRWARRHALLLVADITDTSRKFVRQVIDEYFANPEMTIRELTALLEPRFGQITAEMIAVTETTRAYHEGVTQTANEIRRAGFQMIGIWLTAVDDRVCEICGPLEGAKETYPGSNQWPHPDGMTYTPPAHPRCRCDVAHELV